MYEVCLVLEQFVNAFNDIPLPEHNLVPHGHEHILHLRFQSVYGMYSPAKELLEEFLLDVTSVGKYLSIEHLCENSPYKLSLSSTFAP